MSTLMITTSGVFASSGRPRSAPVSS